jgi:hypothetical protein
LGIEHGFVFEHEIDGASKFDRQDRVSFELIAAHLGFQALGQRADEVMVAFGNDSSARKGRWAARDTDLSLPPGAALLDRHLPHCSTAVSIFTLACGRDASGARKGLDLVNL